MSTINFIKGKWYKYTNIISGFVYYLKFETTGLYNSHHASEYITASDGHYNNGEGSLDISNKKIEKVSIREIKKYLPKGHPDLKRSNINNNYDHE